MRSAIWPQNDLTIQFSRSLIFCPNLLTNHILTIPQHSVTLFSLISVNKLLRKELHFGNPLPFTLCYPIPVADVDVGIFLISLCWQ